MASWEMMKQLRKDWRDCAHRYVYFDLSKLGELRLKHSYTIAMTAFATGKTMGTVIDKSINGSGGKCYATGMAADITTD